jgi:hypothetical protein
MRWRIAVVAVWRKAIQSFGVAQDSGFAATTAFGRAEDCVGSAIWQVDAIVSNDNHRQCMATYNEIQSYVRKKNGFVVKTCWIAHVKADHGLTARLAPNRVNPSKRIHACPPDKRGTIEAALRHFGMI